MARSTWAPRIAVGAAVVAFVGGAGWAGSQVLGGGLGLTGASSAASPDARGSEGADTAGSAVDAGRAFLAAWQAGRYDDMQELVTDPNDDMTRIYGGLAKKLGVRRVVVSPGAALAGGGTALPFHAELTLAHHTYAYDGSVPVRQTTPRSPA